jgi:hypothetical protein
MHVCMHVCDRDTNVYTYIPMYDTHTHIHSRYSYGAKFGREEQRPFGIYELAQVCLNPKP